MGFICLYCISGHEQTCCFIIKLNAYQVNYYTISREKLSESAHNLMRMAQSLPLNAQSCIKLTALEMVDFRPSEFVCCPLVIFHLMDSDTISFKVVCKQNAKMEVGSDNQCYHPSTSLMLTARGRKKLGKVCSHSSVVTRMRKPSLRLAELARKQRAESQTSFGNHTCDDCHRPVLDTHSTFGPLF